MKRAVVAVVAALVVVLGAAPGASAVTAQERDGAGLSLPVGVKRCQTVLTFWFGERTRCGVSFNGRGRVGTYDSATKRYTWGSWHPLHDYDGPTPNPGSAVLATDGHRGPYLGYPRLAIGPDGTTYGTQYKRDEGYRWYGRTGTLDHDTGLFTPDGTGAWHRSSCVPGQACPTWHLEPAPPRS